MSRLDDIFKAYDVRGTTPDQLNPEIARAIGVGFATFCAEMAGGADSVGRVLVARR